MLQHSITFGSESTCVRLPFVLKNYLGDGTYYCSNVSTLCEVKLDLKFLILAVFTLYFPRSNTYTPVTTPVVPLYSQLNNKFYFFLFRCERNEKGRKPQEKKQEMVIEERHQVEKNKKV